MFSKIQNPETGNWVNVNGVVGRKVLRNYVRQMGGVAAGATALPPLPPPQHGQSQKQITKMLTELSNQVRDRIDKIPLPQSPPTCIKLRTLREEIISNCNTIIEISKSAGDKELKLLKSFIYTCLNQITLPALGCLHRASEEPCVKMDAEGRLSNDIELYNDEIKCLENWMKSRGSPPPGAQLRVKNGRMWQYLQSLEVAKFTEFEFIGEELCTKWVEFFSADGGANQKDTLAINVLELLYNIDLYRNYTIYKVYWTPSAVGAQRRHSPQWGGAAPPPPPARPRFDDKDFYSSIPHAIAVRKIKVVEAIENFKRGEGMGGQADFIKTSNKFWSEWFEHHANKPYLRGLFPGLLPQDDLLNGVSIGTFSDGLSREGGSQSLIEFATDRPLAHPAPAGAAGDDRDGFLASLREKYCLVSVPPIYLIVDTSDDEMRQHPDGYHPGGEAPTEDTTPSTFWERTRARKTYIQKLLTDLEFETETETETKTKTKMQQLVYLWRDHSPYLYTFLFI
jgi:hypothetical protein